MDRSTYVSGLKLNEVRMSDLEEALAHYGIKGMKWGVRRSEAELARARGENPPVEKPRPPASKDFEAVVKLNQKIKEGGTRSLSNQELRQYLERIELERRYQMAMAASIPHSNSGGQKKSALEKGHDTTRTILKYGKTVDDVRKFLNTPTGKAVKTGLSTAAAATAAYLTGGTSAAVAAGGSTLLRRAARKIDKDDDKDDEKDDE